MKLVSSPDIYMNMNSFLEQMVTLVFLIQMCLFLFMFSFIIALHLSLVISLMIEKNYDQHTLPCFD